MSLSFPPVPGLSTANPFNLTFNMPQPSVNPLNLSIDNVVATNQSKGPTSHLQIFVHGSFPPQNNMPIFVGTKTVVSYNNEFLSFSHRPTDPENERFAGIVVDSTRTLENKFYIATVAIEGMATVKNYWHGADLYPEQEIGISFGLTGLGVGIVPWVDKDPGVSTSARGVEDVTIPIATFSVAKKTIEGSGIVRVYM